MNTVEAANKAEVAMIHAALNNKHGQLYADIWKVGVNLSLRIGDLLTLKYADTRSSSFIFQCYQKNHQ